MMGGQLPNSQQARRGGVDVIWLAVYLRTAGRRATATCGYIILPLHKSSIASLVALAISIQNEPHASRQTSQQHARYLDLAHYVKKKDITDVR